MEKFSQFRDRGLSEIFFMLLGHANTGDRFRHCAFPPHSYFSLGLCAAATRIPILLPPSTSYICVPELLLCSAMATHWFAGEEGVAMVYTRRAEPVVD
jgi:hypothetical protein